MLATREAAATCYSALPVKPCTWGAQHNTVQLPPPHTHTRTHQRHGHTNSTNTHPQHAALKRLQLLDGVFELQDACLCCRVEDPRVRAEAEGARGLCVRQRVCVWGGGGV
jgi:hypothetical protein